jgi:hypothetical protein
MKGTKKMKPDTENQYIVDFPCWALGALINGDGSGLDAHERLQVEQWEKENPGIYSPGDESYFHGFPEFGLAADCVELTVIPYKPE